MFKGFLIFVFIYTFISGNGDGTFFAWILMLISIIMTILFLDERTNKVTLLVITVLLWFACADGFVSAIPRLLFYAILIVGVYVFVAKCNLARFKKIVSAVIIKEHIMPESDKWTATPFTNTEWQARNVLNPFVKYTYSSITNCFEIKKGLFIIQGIERRIPSSVLVGIEAWEVKIHGPICEITFPVKIGKGIEPLVIQNITRRKWNELKLMF